MKSISRKSLTVDVVMRVRVTFRIGMKVIDSRLNAGTIVSMDRKGATVNQYNNEAGRRGNFWYAYQDLRPHDHRRYLRPGK